MRAAASVTGLALAALALAWALVALAGAAPGEALAAFAKGALGGRRYAYLLNTVALAGLIGGMAVAALVSFRAGLFNLGGEGQLVAGGLAAALVAVYLPGPPALAVAAAALAATAAGAGWALVAGALSVGCGVPLLVGSLLLNYPMSALASWLVSHPFRDVASGLPQTRLIDASRWLPNFPGTRLDVGVVPIVVAGTAALAYAGLTVRGRRARLHGLSPGFARAAGADVRAIALGTLAASGALAGLVGAVAVLGVQHRYSDGMLVQPLYAWSGIVAVLLVGLVPWAVPLAAFFFAALATGAAGMERGADVPREIALVVQAAIILAVAGRVARSLPGGTGGGVAR